MRNLENSRGLQKLLAFLPSELQLSLPEQKRKDDPSGLKTDFWDLKNKTEMEHNNVKC